MVITLKDGSKKEYEEAKSTSLMISAKVLHVQLVPEKWTERL